MNLELLKIHAQTGKTAVLVTHNMTEAVFMSDRIAVMTSRPGRLLGVIEVPFERPRDPSIMRTQEFADLVFEVRKMLGLP
jgi:NitT/TauT family transport system ATP-binding protein